MSLPSGTHLGPYEIVGKIGAGGMGEVYRAKDTRLGRDVAIKVLPRGFSEDQDRLRRFELEAKALAAFSHPNILAVHDVGTHEGSPYLVMELLEGETLRERLQGGALPVKLATELALQIAQGLAAAHAKGLVHRDLKPANLFITKDGHPKILDFGLAKQATASLGEQSQLPTRDARSLTSEGVALGTVGYMSPEQVTGKPADARSDIFAFGAVLYEMLSGRRAFERSSAFETLSATLKEDPPELKAPEGTIPLPLQRLVTHCLEKDPDHRFQSAKDLVHGLEYVLEGHSTSAPSNDPVAHRAWPRKQHLRWWVGVGLPGLVIAAGLWAWLPKTDSAITSLAVLPLQNYSGDAQQDYFVDGMTDALIADLAQIKALKIISRTSVMQYKSAKKSLPEIARELRVQGILEGSVLRVGNRVRITAQLIDARNDQHLWVNNYERNLTDVIALQREVVREIASQIRVQVSAQERGRLSASKVVDPTVYDTTLRASALFEHGTLEKDFRQAIAMFQSALDRDPSYAPAWAGLASATWSLAEAGLEFVAPAEVRDKAIAAVDKALGLDPDLPEAHEARAFIAMEGEWNLARAKEEFEKALELRPSYAKCHSELGTLLLFLNDFSGAQGHLKMAEELDPFSPYVAFNRILVFNQTGHPEQGLAAGKRMLQADPGNWLIPAEMGYSHLALERYAEAAEDFERCLKVGERSGATLGKLGYACARAGRRQEAQKILTEFERAKRTVFVPPHRTAWILIGLGRKEEAIQDLESAFQLRVGSLIWIAPRPMEWRIFLGGMEDVRLTQLRRRIVQAIQFPGGRSPWDEP